MIFIKANDSLKIYKRHLVFIFAICLFILSEYCPIFQTIDHMHLKHIVVVGIIFFFFLKNHRILFSNELKLCLCTVAILYGITLFDQMLAGRFEMYSISEVYYLIIPIIFVEIIYDSNKEVDMDDIMSSILYCSLFSFLVSCVVNGTLSWNNFIKMFDLTQLFVESESPMIESGLSSFFVILYIYFLYREKRGRAFLSAFGAFLGFKRLAVLYMLLLTVFHKFIPKNKGVQKYIVVIAITIFIFLPFLAKLMCSDEFANWFYLQFGVNFNKFTMTRFEIINLVIDADLPKLGLGTTTHFLELRGLDGQLNMHNDILRIYLECGIIGSIALSINYFKMAADQWYSFLTMLFIMLQMFVTHCLGSGTISTWILAYMVIFYTNRADGISKNLPFSCS